VTSSRFNASRTGEIASSGLGRGQKSASSSVLGGGSPRLSFAGTFAAVHGPNQLVKYAFEMVSELGGAVIMAKE